MSLLAKINETKAFLEKRFGQARIWFDLGLRFG